MSEPLVSVHMITYNHAPFIAKAIESVLAQKTNFPFELVIGEDCSSDGTREIVLDYARRYPEIIRVVTSKQNVGMKKNSLRTSQACRGNYIAWCEGDDFWHRENKLQIQIDCLEEKSECGLVYSDCDWHFTEAGYTEKGHLKTSGRSTLYAPSITDIVAKKVDIRTCTVLARRDLIEEIKLADPYLHGSEKFLMGDTQLWAETSLKTKIYFINDSLATYRILEESATQSGNGIKRLLFGISDAEMYLYLCKKHNLPPHIREKHEANLRRGLLQLAFIQKNRDLAEIIKRDFGVFASKDLVWYFGVKYSVINMLMQLLLPLIKKSWRCQNSSVNLPSNLKL